MKSLDSLIPIPELEVRAADPDTIPMPAPDPDAEPVSPAQPKSARRKRGRPKGSKTRHRTTQPAAAGKPAAEPIADLTAEPEAEAERARQSLAAAIAFSLSVGCDYLAAQRGPHWQLSNDEATQLGGLWATALAPYLTSVGPYTPWLAAVMGTVAVAAPRLWQDQRTAIAPATGRELEPEGPTAPPVPMTAEMHQRTAAGESPVPIDPPPPARKAGLVAR